jgi:type III secretion protein J
MNRARPWLGLWALCLLSACADQDLFVQLTEPQANEMVAALRSASVAAEKAAREGGVFAVTVPQDAFPRAVGILRAQGLPRGGFDSLGQVFKKEGFLSSPLEERARLTHALSQEIANTLSNIDGVVLARVHVSMPERDRLSDRSPAAAASVFIKHRANVDLSGQTGSIKALVVHSIEGLAYEDVTVVLFPADVGASQPGDRVPGQTSPLPATLGGAGLALGTGLLGLGFVPALRQRWMAGFRGVRHGR